MAKPHSTADAAGLPPQDAIEFLRQKTNITSEHWTDVWQEAHSRSFMVAGAASQALVEDFRRAVAKALETGTTLAEFRADFDAIVAKHGWVHNGTAAWRSRIIYETNLSTAYSAGRYRQMIEPATLEAYPYWQYVHNFAVHPRVQHVDWDGLTLRANDGWWDSHYPPNGWRCHCSIRIVSEGGLRRMGKTAPDSAPPLDPRPWRNPHTGEIVQVPRGIDPGFAYNPGKAWKQGSVADLRADGLPAIVPSGRGRPAMPPAAAVRPPGGHAADYHKWVREQLDQGRPDGSARVVGALSPKVMKRLGDDAPETPDITLTSSALRHLTRDAKAKDGKTISHADIVRLPEILKKPGSVLRDIHRGELLVTFDPSGLDAAGDHRKGKVVVRLRQNVAVSDGKHRSTKTANLIVTAGLVPHAALKNRGNYEVLEEPDASGDGRDDETSDGADDDGEE